MEFFTIVFFSYGLLVFIGETLNPYRVFFPEPGTLSSIKRHRKFALWCAFSLLLAGLLLSLSGYLDAFTKTNLILLLGIFSIMVIPVGAMYFLNSLRRLRVAERKPVPVQRGPLRQQDPNEPSETDSTVDVLL